MRNEGTGILPAIDEAVRIGREAHIPSKSGISKWWQNRVGATCPKHRKGEFRPG